MSQQQLDSYIITVKVTLPLTDAGNYLMSMYLFYLDKWTTIILAESDNSALRAFIQELNNGNYPDCIKMLRNKCGVDTDNFKTRLLIGSFEIGESGNSHYIFTRRKYRTKKELKARTALGTVEKIFVYLNARHETDDGAWICF